MSEGVDPLSLSVALGDYDHVRDLVSGAVQARGVALNFTDAYIPDMFRRFRAGEWDVSEFGMGKYVALRATGDMDFTGIPVFPGRAFRQSCVYVREDSQLLDLKELEGKKVGIPEWAQTAGIYFRGCLVHHVGVPLDAVTWVQAGINSPGRKESVTVSIPDGVDLESRRDDSLIGMLLEGTIDAMASAEPPAAYLERRGVRRLLADPIPHELEYFRATGVFPIMHVVAVRQRLLDRHPWLSDSLFQAFSDAKSRSLTRLADPALPRVPLPFAALYAEEFTQTFGDDPWPYGIEANRSTLEAFLGYAHEQGVTRRLVEVDELFAVVQ